MEELEKHPPVVKLKWFTKGYYAFSAVGEDVVMTDEKTKPDSVDPEGDRMISCVRYLTVVCEHS